MSTKIKVNGIGQIKIKPDAIFLNLTLSKENKDSKKAFEDEKEIKKQLIDNLKVLNIKEEELKTTDFQMNPIYKTIQKNDIYEQVLNGYRITENLVLKLPFNIDYLNEVLEAINDIKESIHFNINFQNTEDYEKELLELAFNDALKTATAISSISNLKLDGIDEIITQNTPNIRNIAYKASFDITPEDITIQKEIEVIFKAKEL